jgi:thymidylate synthase ThyX
LNTTTHATIVADSVSPAGQRLTTFECVFPRIILAEVNTHKMISKNSASSRAIPVERMIARVLEDPYVPTHWGKNQKGMSAAEDVDEDDAADAIGVWLAARDVMVEQVKDLLHIGIHKQLTNRLIEPFMHHTAVVTGTEWSNFFNLRDTKDAHPDFRDLAHAMRELYGKSEPKRLDATDWHLPYVSDADFEQCILENPQYPLQVQDHLCKVSVGRCARVSYDRLHEEEMPEKAKARCDGMLSAGHMSPFEHVARPMSEDELELFKQRKLRWNEEHGCWVWVGAKYHHLVDPDDLQDCEAWDHDGRGVYQDGEYTHFLGNLNGWVQYRKQIPHEEDILGARA